MSKKSAKPLKIISFDDDRTQTLAGFKVTNGLCYIYTEDDLESLTSFLDSLEADYEVLDPEAEDVSAAIISAAELEALNKSLSPGDNVIKGAASTADLASKKLNLKK